MKKVLFPFIGCLLLLCSCGKIMRSAYGIRKPLSNTEALATLVRTAPLLSKYNNFYFDTGYFDAMSIHFREDSQAHKNALQPIQLYYFDQNDSIVSYHINCYVGGFPNLRWNEDGNFNVFPPITRVPLPVAQQYTTLKKFMRPLAPSIDSTINKPAYKVVLLWNYQVYRQSRNLLKLVLKNIEKQRVRLELVNTDFMHRE